MFNAANQVSIFAPMLVVVALTFVAFVRMDMARAATAKQVDPEFYRAHQGAGEPASTVAAVRHYGNLMELPTLFYAACLTAFVLTAVTGWVLVFAWGYAIARVLQSVIHMTYNAPTHRGLAFVLGVVFMLILWINLGMAICARL